MKRLTRWVVVMLLLTQLLSLSAVAALAAPEAKDAYNPALSAEEIQAQLGLAGDVQILTADQMNQLIQLCHRIGAYLVRHDDGTLSLDLQDPNRVGVDPSFLNDYRTSLQEINALIRMGWLTVDDEFNLQPGSALPAEASAIDQGLKQVEDQVAGKVATDLPADAETAYYGGFLFSFHSGLHHIPYHYASFGPTFASRFHYGHYGARFSLLFGLHPSFFHRTFSHGGYGYVPYYSSYRYGYHRFYYYPYHYGGYGGWHYTYLWY